MAAGLAQQKYYEKNRALVTERARNWRLSNPDRYTDLKRKSLYGITREEYDKMRETQDFRCAICRRHESEFRVKLCVDHNHVNDQIRALLCNPCNTAMGQLQEDLDRMQRMIEYLKSFRVEVF